MDLLLKDGIRYLPYRYKNEAELQNYVQSNIHHLFGPDALFFPGVRIGAGRGQNGVRGIPDGFVLAVPQKRWYIVEVELARHSYFDHIAPQVMRFYAAWENTSRRRELKDRFANVIQESPVRIETLSKHGIKEVYRFISDVLEEKPTLAVIIDEEVKDLDQLKNIVQFDVQSSIFRTFRREGVSDLVPIFQVNTLEGIEGPTEFPQYPLSAWIGAQDAEGYHGTNGDSILSGNGEFLIFLGKKERISTTKEILVKVANELIRHGALTENMLPWGPGKKRYIVSKAPIHPRGNDFFAPVKLENGWWVETHSGRDNTLSYASHLLKKCGQNPKIVVELD